MRTVVRITSLPDRQLSMRVRGQTSDLNVVLVLAHTKAVEETLQQQLGTADELARKHQARAVVWFQHGGTEADAFVVVRVSETEKGRMLTRKVGATTEVVAENRSIRLPAASGTFEAAALIVRSALHGYSMGAPVGVPTPRAPQRPKSPAVPPPQPPAAQRASAGPRWVVSLGSSSAIDGVSPHGRHGVSGAVSAELGRWVVGLGGTFGLTASIDQPLATIKLSRHALGAFVGAFFRLWDGFDLVVQSALGVALFSRSTISQDARLEPTADRTTAALLIAPRLLVRWLPAFARRRLALVLAAGADISPQAPSLDYQRDGETEFGPAIWRVQPQVGVHLQLHFGGSAK